MCWLFNREFYRCLRLVIQAHANKSPQDRRFFWCLPIFCVVVPALSIAGICICPEVIGQISSWVLLILGAATIFHTAHELGGEALAKFNIINTSETSSSRRATSSSSEASNRESEHQYLESYLEWLKNQRMFQNFPHWSPFDVPNEESERLRAMRENNQYLLQNIETLRQGRERLHSQQSLDSSVAESSFIETEQDSNVESNLLPQVTHRSRHPSTSAEAQPSSHIVTEAEVYRRHSEESD